MGNNENRVEALTTRFRVVIPGLRNMTFRSCEGLKSEVEVRQLDSGASMAPAKTARGAQRVTPICFGQGVVSPESSQAARDTIFDWYMDVCDSSKKLEKKNISIMLLDGEKNTMAEWKIRNAWPCQWHGPMLHTMEMSNETIEFVGFAHEGIEAKK